MQAPCYRFTEALRNTSSETVFCNARESWHVRRWWASVLLSKEQLEQYWIKYYVLLRTSYST